MYFVKISARNNEETLYANESRGSQNLIASHQQQLQEEIDNNQPIRNEVNSAYSQAAILQAAPSIPNFKSGISHGTESGG